MKSQEEIDEPVAATGVKKEELALAQQIISGLEGDFDAAELRSDYRAELRELLEAKLEGRELAEPAPQVEDAPVIDLMEALRASVAASKGEHGREEARDTQEAHRRRRAERCSRTGSSAFASAAGAARRSPPDAPGRASCRSCPGRSGRAPRCRSGSPRSRSMPTSFDSSSGVRWLAMSLLSS